MIDRQERMAQLLASYPRMTARMAAITAGYSAETAAAKAHVLARKVGPRVVELRGATPHPAAQAPEPQQPEPQQHQPAPLPQRPEPQQQAPIQQQPVHQQPVPPPHMQPAPVEYEPPRPLPRIDISRASRDEVRRWSLHVLAELTHEAHTARDRRVVTSALAEISKLSGTYAPTRVDAVHVNVLEGMSIDELRLLLRVLDDPDLLAQARSDQPLIEAQAEDVTDMEEVKCDPLS